MHTPNEFATLEIQRNAGLSVKNASSRRACPVVKAHQATPVQLVKLVPQVLQVFLVPKVQQDEMVSADQRVFEAHPVLNKDFPVSTVVMVFQVHQAALVLMAFGVDKVATVPSVLLVIQVLLVFQVVMVLQVLQDEQVLQVKVSLSPKP